MDNIIQIFIAQSYWIDVTIICGITLAFTFWIGMFRTSTLVKRNIQYNEELKKLRRNIYLECEKNFFL